MPGITLHYIKDQERVNSQHPELQTLFSSSHFEILLRAGDEYPIQKVDFPDYVAFVEGKIYGEKIEGISFTNALNNLWKNEPDSSNYFWKLDGEFVIFMASKSSDKAIVINDFLGRLPVYICNGNSLIISRDLFSIHKILGELEFDLSGIYQYLRLGFPLGQKTLYRNIEKVRYKTLFLINSNKVKKEFGPELNIHGSVMAEANAINALSEHFQESVKSRSQVTPIALSLSGGLDSRAILGSLEKERLRSELFTFHYSNPIIDKDLQVSQDLAKLYNKPLKKVHLKEWSPQNFQQLIKAKMGMNYLGMAFVFEFLKSLSGCNLMLTGDGGDKTLAPLHPLVAPSEKNLTKYILSQNQISSLEELKEVIDLDWDKEEQKIAEHLLKLPGNSTKEKYKSFLLFERGMNWLFEGEDRNRELIWSTSPFYNPDFFEFAHSISESEKANYALFRRFLDQINPDLNKITNANWDIPLGDEKSVRQLFAKQKIKQFVKKFYKKKVRVGSSENPTDKALMDHLAVTNFSEKLPMKRLEKKEINTGLAWHLLTLAYLSSEIEDM